jgi:hypothetical protein
MVIYPKIVYNEGNIFVMNDQTQTTQTSMPSQETNNKPETSWVSIILLFFLVGGLVGASWFYFNMIFEAPQPHLAELSFESVAPTYVPEDILQTSFAGHKADYDENDLKAISYIFSRDQVLQVSLMSGTGQAMNFQKNYIEEQIKIVDTLNSFTLPENIQTLSALYLEAHSSYHTTVKWDDFATTDLTRPQDRYMMSDEALGWLILLETEWAKHMQIEKFFGTAEESEYAMYRVYSMIMLEAAKRQAKEWYENPARTQTITGDYVFATALMNLAATLEAEKLPGVSGGNPFKDTETASELRKKAETLLEEARTPVSLRDIAIASSMLGWYGSLDASAQDTIISTLKLWLERLNLLEKRSIEEKAYAVISYIEMGKRLNNPSLTDLGWEIYEKLKVEYVTSDGRFLNQKFYTTGEVAAVLQMLNRINEAGGNYWNQREVSKFKLEIFESLVLQGKLQRSYFPPEFFPTSESLFESFEMYPSMATAELAGGSYGKAPLTGHKNWYNNDHWTLLDDKYLADEGLYYAYVLQTMSSDYFSDIKNWRTQPKPAN